MCKRSWNYFSLWQEAENYRSEYNKLRYDLTFLKSEFDHQKEEHVRVLEERRIRHEADVCFIILNWILTQQCLFIKECYICDCAGGPTWAW